MVKKKTAKQEVDEVMEDFDDKDQEEDFEEPEEPEEPEEEDLAPRRKKKVVKKSELAEPTVEKLKKQLAVAEANQNKKKFIESAPQRIEELEKVVSQNRSYLLKINEQLQNFQQQLAMMVAK